MAKSRQKKRVPSKLDKLLKRARKLTIRSPLHAIKLLDKAARIEKDNAVLLKLQAISYLNAGWLDDAQRAAEKLVSILGDASRYLWLARIYFAKGWFDEAEQAARQSVHIRLSENNAVFLAETLRKLKQYQEAIDFIQKHCQSVKSALCKAYCYLELKDFQESYQAFIEAEELMRVSRKEFLHNPKIRLYAGYIFLYSQYCQYLVNNDLGLEELEKAEWFKKAKEAAIWLQSVDPNKIGLFQMHDFHSALRISKSIIIK